MAVYTFRCPGCGPHDTAFPIGTAPDTARCPRCGHETTRVYTAPTLTSTSAAETAWREREGRSAESPTVVTAVPLAARRMSKHANPLHATLPRP